MNPKRVEVWVWVLIYAGLILFGLGLSVQRTDASLGWVVAAVGVVLASIGAVLIWVRSRMKETKGTPP
jgi:protein-S-isoprenylcysteine O-methyltransferase Ste14